MHNDAMKSMDRRERRRVPLMVRDYMLELKEHGYEAGSIRNMVKPIKSFFSTNELDFNIKRNDQPVVVHDG
jgi:hypothetical protein